MDIQIIQNKIYEIRGQRVMLDRDLAELYGVSTGNLNKAVKRNIERFPEDFMFQLTEKEWRELVTNCDRLPSTIKHSSVLPSAFTQEGVASLSGVLKSPIAVNVYLSIMRAFVAMRNYIMQSSVVLAELAEFRSRLLLVERDCRENLEAMNDLSEDVRRDFDTVFEAIGALSVKLPEAKKSRQPIGFKIREKE